MKYKVQIANPCEEKWEGMTPVEGGKFCMHCSKTVIDFTNLSDEAILKAMKNGRGNVCGRLREDQLNRELVIKPELSFFHAIVPKIAASLLLFVGIETAEAQVKKYATQPVQQVAQTNPQVSKPIAKKKISGKLIQGRVSGPSNSGIPFATVFLKNANIHVKTDAEGNFKLFVPAHLLKSKIILIGAAEGYSNKEFIIDKKDLLVKQELMLENYNMTVTVEAKAIPLEKSATRMGAIAQCTPGKMNTRRWWQFWKR